MRLLAIDPGADTGWASFRDRRLTACGVGRPEAFDAVSEVVIEKPQVYRTRLQKGDPNDLITLAIMVGEYKARAEVALASVVLVTPAEWKGQVPKTVHHRRIERALSSEELGVTTSARCASGKRHNMLDAIGLGLWRLGRM